MALVHASGTLTASGAFTDTQTVVVGQKTYTTQTTLTNVDGNVLIGANAEETLANLKAAINLEAGAGTTYAAAMTENKHVRATFADATTLVVKAKLGGTIGNSIASTETQTNAAWGAATLASGTGDFVTDLQAVIDNNQMNGSVEQSLRNLFDPANLV